MIFTLLKLSSQETKGMNNSIFTLIAFPKEKLIYQLTNIRCPFLTPFIIWWHQVSIKNNTMVQKLLFNFAKPRNAGSNEKSHVAKVEWS